MVACKIPEIILSLLLPSGNQSLEGKSNVESDFTFTVVCPTGFSATIEEMAILTTVCGL